MKRLPIDNKIKNVHFIGIGGIGLSSLALHMQKCGCKVSGSDRTCTDLTEHLASVGIVVHYGHSADNIPSPCDLVVCTSAIPLGNVERQEALRRGIPLLLREQLLGIVFDGFERKVAVSGVHGKTTVTAMLDTVLRALKVPHTAFVGGVNEDSGSNYSSGGTLVVAEACEFRQSFKYLHPDIAVVLNIELDHPDCYPDEDSMYATFGNFLDNVTSNGTVVACGDNIRRQLLVGRSVVTFGLQEHNDFRAVNLSCDKGLYSFDLVTGETTLCRVHLGVHGKHNVYNALAVLTVLARLRYDIRRCAQALSTFCGAQRRFMPIDCTFTQVVEDYAHHPTEIRATIAAAQEIVGNGRLFVFFQPHTYSRTRALWQQFVRCFDNAHFVGLLPVYSAREQPIEGVNSASLAQDINKRDKTSCAYFDTMDSAATYARANATASDMVLVVGAGDIYQLSHLLTNLR